MDQNTEFPPGTIKLEDLQPGSGRDKVILHPTPTDDPNDPLVGTRRCVLTGGSGDFGADMRLPELVKMAENC